jgi:hypothetical protein
MYERIKPGVDPLGPDDILGFTTGILTANPVPGADRGIYSRCHRLGFWLGRRIKGRPQDFNLETGF